MFTKAFLEALSEGLPPQRERLSLREVKDLAASFLSEIRNAPRPVVLSPDQSEGDVADIPFFPNPRAEEERERQAEEARRRLAEEAERTRRMEEERQRRVEEERARQAEEERMRKAREEEQASQVKQPEPVPVVPVSETTGTSQSQQSKEMATPVPIIPFSQQAVSEVSADMPAQPQTLIPLSSKERLRQIEEESRRLRKAQEAAQKVEEEPPVADSLPQSPVWRGSIASPSQLAPHSMPVPLPSTPRPTKHGISRRTVVMGLGLAGLAVASSGIVWLASYYGQHQSVVSGSTPTPVSSPSSTPIPMGKLLYTYRGHSDIVNTLAWSPDGKRIASGGGTIPTNPPTLYPDESSRGIPTPTPTPKTDSTVQVWDAADGGHVFTYRGMEGDIVLAVAWSPDGKRIASGGRGSVQVWNAADGGNVFNPVCGGLICQDYYFPPVAWSPNGKRIASDLNVTMVQVWDAANGGNAFTYRGHSDQVEAVAWSPNGRRIASGSGDTTVQVWDATDGGHVYTYHGHSSTVFAVAWSPDGTRIASAEGHDKTVQVWDAADGRHVFTYRGHFNTVNAVAWSPDGKRIASSDGNTVQVWDAANGGHVLTYRGESAVAWSPDGKRIAWTAGKTVQVWMVP